MKKIFAAIMIVVAMCVAFGMGESYLAQQELTDRIETAARREELANEFLKSYEEYYDAIGVDYHIRAESIEEDGLHVVVCGFANDERFVIRDVVLWSEMTESINDVDAHTMAALYSE